MKLLRFIGNILWFFTAGIVLFLEEVSAGILSFCLIIPIFFGIPWVHFKIAVFMLAPFGKTAELHFFKAPVRNTFSFILGGFASSISLFVFGILFCITIVGIPIGKVMFKIAKLGIAPFHFEISKKN